MSPLLSRGYRRAVLPWVRGARLSVGSRGASGGPGGARDSPAGAGLLQGEVDRFGGVSVRLGALDRLDAAAFQRGLQAAVQQWRSEGRVAVWLHVPIPQSRFIAPAAALGFRFHHAEADSSTLTLWLGQGPSRLPGYATHQVGVAGIDNLEKLCRRLSHKAAYARPITGEETLGNQPPASCWKEHLFMDEVVVNSALGMGAVFDENTGKILVVQDRNKLKNMWKFPGGLSEPGEDIGDTAVREVFEETGVRSEFRSLLSVRQQHNHPGAFGKSDMYIICRLEPRSFAIEPCPHECLRCEWMDLAELATAADTTPITSRAARLLLYGHREGFDKIDLPAHRLPAVHTGLFYKLYHRELPGRYRTMTRADSIVVTREEPD